MKLKKNNTIKNRLPVQGFFFLLVLLIMVNHGLKEAEQPLLPFISSASIHAICPFGGVVTLYEFVSSGNLVPRTHESSIVLMTISLFLALLFGPVICGWVCPLGSVQEWVGTAGKRLMKETYNHIIPLEADRLMRFLRYGVLVWVMYVTATTVKLVFQEYDPYYALFHFWSTDVAVSALVILGVTLFASLFVERPWCKYACPFGAVLGISNYFRLFGIKRRVSTCISCGACDRICPMNIHVSTAKTVRNHQCITCMKCTSEAACPVADTVALYMGFPRGKEGHDHEH